MIPALESFLPCPAAKKLAGLVIFPQSM